MKIKLIPIAGLALLIAGVNTASAALIDRGNGLIYDDDLNITWLADANYAATQYAETNGAEGGPNASGRMTWFEATDWAADLEFGGYSDWRLFSADANCSLPFGSSCTDNELAHLYYNELDLTIGDSITTSGNPNYGLFSNVQSYRYWSSDEYIAPNFAGVYRYFETSSGVQNISPGGNEFYAWAVRDGDVTAVPEPGTVLLLAAGLIGIAGVKRRRS